MELLESFSRNRDFEQKSGIWQRDYHDVWNPKSPARGGVAEICEMPLKGSAEGSEIQMIYSNVKY